MARRLTAHTVIQQLLDGIELRERRLVGQIRELAARLRETEAEREALQTTAKTIHAMSEDLELDQPPAPAPPDGAAYQQNIGVFDHERRPPRARDPCLAPDPPVLPKHVEGTRAKLKRLVGLGFLDETDPRLFTQPGQSEQPAPADQRP
jgi:hypothetical protein